MKRPKPQIPTNAPAGTVWSGGPIDWFKISLQIRGDDVVPSDITSLLGCEPDAAAQKDEPLYRKDGTLMRISRSGFWTVVLKPLDTDEWDCGEAIWQLIRRLPADPAMWTSLSRRFNVSFLVGLRMPARNKGFELSSELLRYLGGRGISAGFDIYYEEEVERAQTDIFEV